MATVILSGIPFNCQETDIHRALLMYGTALDIRLHAPQQQAFVTMRTQMEAQALLNRKTVIVLGSTVRVDGVPQLSPAHAAPQAPPSMYGGSGPYAPQQPQQTQAYPAQPYQTPQTQHMVYQQPGQPAQQASMYQPLQPQQTSFYQPQPQASPQAPQHPGYGAYGNPSQDNFGQSVFPAVPQPGLIAARDPRTTHLRVVVEDCKFPITREVLTEMFNMVDKPLHVDCGAPGPTTTGDVEFASVESAERAMTQFNNKNIYPNCCLLHISYAPPRDYERGSDVVHRDGNQAVMPAPTSNAAQGESFLQQPAMMDSATGGDRGGRGSVTGRGVAMARGGRGGAAVGRGGAHPGVFDPFRGPPHGPVPTPYDSRRPPFPPAPQPEETAVAISNVSEAVPLYDLWVLLEVFGNVNSLKRQFKDKTNVIAQFQNAADAKTAVFFLQGCPFRGRVLGLKVFAGYVERGGRVEWNAGPATDPATQAVLFTSGFHHRTKPSAPFNPLGRIRPDKNIFLSNLIDAITDEEVKAEFARAGLQPEGYHRKDGAAAILAFKDTETAVDALIAVHGRQLKDRFLRLTFSRFPPSPCNENARDGEDGGDASGGNEEAPATAPPPPASAAAPHGAAAVAAADGEARQESQRGDTQTPLAASPAPVAARPAEAPKKAAPKKKAGAK